MLTNVLFLMALLASFAFRLNFTMMLIVARRPMIGVMALLMSSCVTSNVPTNSSFSRGCLPF